MASEYHTVKTKATNAIVNKNRVGIKKASLGVPQGKPVSAPQPGIADHRNSTNIQDQMSKHRFLN